MATDELALEHQNGATNGITSTNGASNGHSNTKSANKPLEERRHLFDISYYLSRYFYWHGRICATHPFKVIVTSLVLVAICSLGLLNFRTEANAIKLWIPRGSDFAKNYEFLWNKYPIDIRFHSIVFLAPEHDPNILQPKYFQHMFS